MSYQTLEFAVDDGIGTLTFNRPEVRNAISDVMIAEFEAVLEQVDKNSDLRVLIVTGTGNCFMAGGDIGMMRVGIEQPYEFLLMHDRLTRSGVRLGRLRVPVLAAINGHAFGGGLELALACDLRVMSETAKLGLPEVGLGIMPGSGGTARLARLVGRERALYLELTGQAIDAAEAIRMGLVLKVVPPDQVLAAARELAVKIAAQAPAAVAMIKRAVTLAADMPLEGAIDYCQAAALLLGGSRDCREGFDAFLEKRPPKWSGR